MLNIHWKNWCWSWNSNSLATWCEEPTHWKRPQCWERLKAGGKGDSRGWDGWMASLTRWAWVWVNSRSLWRTGRPGVLRFMGSQRVGHDWATDLIWSDSWLCSTFQDIPSTLTSSLLVIFVFISAIIFLISKSSFFFNPFFLKNSIVMFHQRSIFTFLSENINYNIFN